MPNATPLTKELAIICDAAEEWAVNLHLTADVMGGQGPEGKRAAAITRQEAQEIRDAVKAFRPLRRWDEETNDWVE